MEAALRTAYELITGTTLEDVNFTAVRGMEGIKEATVKIGDLDVKVAVCSSHRQGQRTAGCRQAPAKSSYHLHRGHGLPRRLRQWRRPAHRARPRAQLDQRARHRAPRRSIARTRPRPFARAMRTPKSSRFTRSSSASPTAIRRICCCIRLMSSAISISEFDLLSRRRGLSRRRACMCAHKNVQRKFLKENTFRPFVHKSFTIRRNPLKNQHFPRCGHRICPLRFLGKNALIG